MISQTPDPVADAVYKLTSVPLLDSPDTQSDQDEPPHYSREDTSAPTTPLAIPLATPFSAPYSAPPWVPPSYFPPSSGIFPPDHPQQTSPPPVTIHAPSPQLPFNPNAMPLPTVEDPEDPLYRKQVQEELKLQEDHEVLLAELKGDRVVPVHGCGMWAYTCVVY